MLINNSVSGSFFNSIKGSIASLQQSNSNTNLRPVTSVYKADSVSLNSIIQKPILPDNQQPQTGQQTSFFDKGGVRLAGMVLGASAILGTAGYFIGGALGAAGIGTALGIGLGIAAPVAMIVYALRKMN